MAETWLRVATYNIDAGESAQRRQYVEESVQSVIRALTKCPGFRGGQWARDPEANILAAVTNWADRDSIEAAIPELVATRVARKEFGVSLRASANLRVLTVPAVWEPAHWEAVTRRSASNWIRVVFYQPEQNDEGTLEYLRSSTKSALQMLKAQRGFRIGYWGHDPVDGTMAAITYWDSKEAIEAAGPELARLHQERKEHGIETVSVLNLELLAAGVDPRSTAKGFSAVDAERRELEQDRQ